MATRPRMTVRLPAYFADLLEQVARALGQPPSELAAQQICGGLRDLVRDPTIAAAVAAAAGDDAEVPRGPIIGEVLPPEPLPLERAVADAMAGAPERTTNNAGGPGRVDHLTPAGKVRRGAPAPLGGRS